MELQEKKPSPQEEATTDAKGGYEISYSRTQFRRAEKQSADLIVRVFDPAAPGLRLAESDLLMNAPPIATVNLQVCQEFSEYERYLAMLEPLREYVPIADLTVAGLSGRS